MNITNQSPINMDNSTEGDRMIQLFCIKRLIS